MTDPEPVVCPRCGGAGEIFWTVTPWGDNPPYDASYDCQDCGGNGVVEAEAL